MEDGGAFVPLSLPILKSDMLAKLLRSSFCERLEGVLSLIFEGVDLSKLCEDALSAAGGEPSVTKIEDGMYILSLAEGATGRADDIALCLAARLYPACRRRLGYGGSGLAICAGDGEIGRTLLNACKGVDGLAAVALYERSDKEGHRLEAPSQNTAAICVKREDIPKISARLKEDAEFKDKLRALGFDAVDFGQNICRTAAYVAIFISAYCDLVESGELCEGEKFDVALSSDDMCVAVAGCWAKLMGLPIDSLVVASRDEVIPSFVNEYRYEGGKGILPAGIEQLLYELCGRSAGKTKIAIEEFLVEGKFKFGPDKNCAVYKLLEAGSADRSDIFQAARGFFKDDDVALDEETAAVASVYNEFSCVKGKDMPALIVQGRSPYLDAEGTLSALGIKVKGGDAVRTLEEETALDVPEFISRKVEGGEAESVSEREIYDMISEFLKTA